MCVQTAKYVKPTSGDKMESNRSLGEKENIGVSVIGCGFLGYAVAQCLLQNGTFVCGTTTRLEKLKILRSAGILPALMRLDRVASSTESPPQVMDASPVLRQLFSQPTILCTLPASVFGDGDDFRERIESLLARASHLKHFLFISSTSVYGEIENQSPSSHEAKRGFLDEASPCRAVTGNGAMLIEGERFLQEAAKEKNFRLTIIRPGGLIGFERHPGKFLAGRKNVKDPEHPVNLIHQVDLARSIDCLMRTDWHKSDEFGDSVQVFNAVSEYHPQRRDFYESAARELGLPLPEFAPQDPDRMPGKTILGERLLRATGQRFLHNDLVIKWREDAT